MLIIRNIEQLFACFMAYLLWGWLGASICFVCLACTAFLDYFLVRRRLSQLEDVVKYLEKHP